MACRFCAYKDEDLLCNGCGVKVCAECARDPANNGKWHCKARCLVFGEEGLMPIGNHKGKEISKVPAPYLYWIINQDWFKPKYPKLFEQIVKDLAIRRNKQLRRRS